MASRLSTTATTTGSADWLGAGGATLDETGLLAPSTVDFACAATSLAAASSSPLVSIRCFRSCGTSAGCWTGFWGARSGLLSCACVAGAYLLGRLLVSQ